MLSKRKLNIMYIIGVMSLMMGGFQNCAEQPMPFEEGNLRGGNLDMVQVVDQWSEHKLKFVESEVTVDEDEQQVMLHGFCHRQLADGENFVWDLVDSSGEDVITDGNSLCTGGGFQVELENVNDLNCDESYEIHVQSEDGEQDVMYLTKNCST